MLMFIIGIVIGFLFWIQALFFMVTGSYIESRCQKRIKEIKEGKHDGRY